MQSNFKKEILTWYIQRKFRYPRQEWGNTTREQKFGLEFEKNEYDQIDSYCREKKID